MKDSKCYAYNHTYKCNEKDCDGCGYRMNEKNSTITIKQFLEIMHASYRCTFYLNDKLVDLDALYDCNNVLTGFEFEDGNIVRLYC